MNTNSRPFGRRAVPGFPVTTNHASPAGSGVNEQLSRSPPVLQGPVTPASHSYRSGAVDLLLHLGSESSPTGMFLNLMRCNSLHGRRTHVEPSFLKKPPRTLLTSGLR